MIRRILGIAAIVSLALPVLAQAQGVPGGISYGVYEGNRRAGPVGAVVGGAVSSVALTVFWASMSVRAFAAMLSSNVVRRISIAKRFVSAPYCRMKASPITTLRRNTDFASTATLL